MIPFRGGWAVVLTLLLALTLSVTHFPFHTPWWFTLLRPEWVLLAVFYWGIERPDRVPMIFVWILGLVLDVLQGSPFGINGLCLAAVAFVAWSFYERIRMYSRLQQAIVLFFLALGLGCVKSVAATLVQGSPMSVTLVVPAIITMLMWPLVAELIQRCTRRLAWE